MGSSFDPEEIKKLYRKGKKWITEKVKGQDMFTQKTIEDEEKQVVKHLLSNVDNILINGTEKLLTRVYNRIGFDNIDDEILKYLTIARLSQPMSKSATDRKSTRLNSSHVAISYAV